MVGVLPMAALPDLGLTNTKQRKQKMNIVHTPTFPPVPSVAITALPILGAILVGCAAKAIWDKIFD